MKSNVYYLMAVSLLAAGLIAGCGRHDAASEHGESDHAHADNDGHDHGSHGKKNEKKKDAHDHGGEKSEKAQSGHDDDDHAEEIALSPESIQKSGIRISVVENKLLNEIIPAPGRVAFNTEKMAHVGTPVSGRIAEIRVRIGENVKQGDVLLIVQSKELGESQSNYLLKRLAVDAAGPALDMARLSFERAKKLYSESEGLTLAELQKREAEYKVALNARLTAKAEADAAENHLRLMGADQKAIDSLVSTGTIIPQYEVRAPISGQVVEREVTPGEYINPEREALAVIADMSSLWVLADVAETKLGHIRIGSPAQVRVANHEDRTFSGKVSFIAPAIDPATRTASIRIDVSDAGTLRPGMFVQTFLTAHSDGVPVLAIPEEATQLVEGQTVVFVPVEGKAGLFAKRPVKTGRAVGRLLPVLEGLNVGERYVSAGSFILKAEHGKSSAGHEH